MTKKQAVNKVKKLYKLARSSNEAEALNALEKAKKIIVKYKISLTEVQFEKDKENTIHRIIDFEISTETWAYQLIGVLNENYPGKIYARKQTKEGNTFKPMIVGDPVSLDILEYTIRFIFSKLSQMASDAIPPFMMSGHDKFKRAYKEGAVIRLERFFNEQRRYQAEGTDLVVSDTQNIEKYMKDTPVHHTSHRFDSARNEADAEARAMGFYDAKKINFNKGIGK